MRREPTMTVEFTSKNSRLYRWFTKMKISRIIMILIAILVLVPLLSHYYLGGLGSDPVKRHRSRTKLDKSEEVDLLKATDLVHRIDELKRIRRSVNNELRDLESRRQKLHSESTTLNTHLETLKNEYRLTQKSLTSLRVSLESAKLLQSELSDKNTPVLRAPLRIVAGGDNMVFKPRVDEMCRMVNCFDYSRCPLTSGFPVYIYPFSLKDNKLQSLLATEKNVYLTNDPGSACLFMIITDSTLIDAEQYEYWRGDGRNHLIINLSSKIQKPIHRAMIAQSDYTFDNFRSNFDLILPKLEEAVDFLPPMVPIHRKYLLTYQSNATINADLLKTLLQAQETDDKLLFQFSCIIDLYDMCKTRRDLLTNSTFSLIITPSNLNSISSSSFIYRLQESLSTGAVPVILGADSVELPYSELIQWHKIAVLLAKPRVTELHFILRSLNHNEIFNYRANAREIYTNYFKHDQILNAVLATVRTRISLPPSPVPDEASPSVFNSSFVPLKSPAVDVEPETDDVLGPIEPAIPSWKFRDNFTQWVSLLEKDPFRLYPYTPFEVVLPAEAKFVGSGTGFRPIGRGQGGTGKEFNEALGGNHPREQFTVVMLTYEREAVLINAIGRLKGLPHLNKVLVVWNSPKAPAPDLIWPDIGVEVLIIRTKKNSLNNRFLPYSAIETEAILSIDDDAHLRHDEIMFGFRVWRESRDRLVGFPGRYHAWDVRSDSWLYNSNYSCELSMVLTGAAFFHKYYAYVYSHVMPQMIRDKVDEYMNCEDLAMNLLVSHITRKPPLKVTSRWTFRCPGCPKALSFDDSHFQERHKCLNFFTKVYGYMPLLNTQFRVDSVLFKTRIPHDKQKCFKFI